jgi:hypothetical protein
LTNSDFPDILTAATSERTSVDTFIHTPVYTDTDFGVQHIFRYDNGYGASVIRNDYSYGGASGLYELAVIRFVSSSPHQFTLVYNTPITPDEDVIGHLTPDEVNLYLTQIAAL